jgi:hypothetical protein
MEEFLNNLANDILDEFPDPNPLASLFNPYVGELIADYTRNYNRNTLNE